MLIQRTEELMRVLARTVRTFVHSRVLCTRMTLRRTYDPAFFCDIRSQA